MNTMTQAQIKARIDALENERKEIEFVYLTAEDEMRDSGMYGQVPQRLVDAAEYAQDNLKYWDEDYAEELKCLKKMYKGKGSFILNERI